MNVTRVLVADDHTPTRYLIREVLEDAGFTICAEAADSTSAVQAADASAPDTVVLDVRMPGGGLTAAEVIAERHPDVPILILTVSESDADLFAALAAGASGYWLKGEDPALLPRVIRRIMGGEMIIAGTLIKDLVVDWGEGDLGRLVRRRLAPGVTLTSKEYEVLELLRRGMTTAEIADHLFIATVTVRSHLVKIIRKLNVRNREEALEVLRGTPPRNAARRAN